mgnify:CR=1 FL=1
MRRLLPYEKALIDTLDISKEDYLRFLAYQEEYKDVKDGTVLDVRMGIDPGTIALVLTIVGTLLQVASALLTRPLDPGDPKSPIASRQKRFSPRYGFDSAQELAEYGQPVNLVYADMDANPLGGVRVNTSLLWSAVHSYGSSQYMQMLTAIGCSGIVEIDYNRTAFGQTPARQFVNVGNWIYFRNDGGPLRFADLKRPADNVQDACRKNAAIAPGDNVYKPYIIPADRKDGFSQAYSPASFNVFGIEAPIPIKVLVFVRDENGKQEGDENGVEVDGTAKWPNYYGIGARQKFLVGDTFRLKLKAEPEKGSDGLIADKKLAAFEDRLTYASSIDYSSVYKLGSAKFQVSAVDGSEDLNGDSLRVVFQCIEAGFGPEEDYLTESKEDQAKELRAQISEANRRISELEMLLNKQEIIYISNFTQNQEAAFSALTAAIDSIEVLMDAISFKKLTPAELDEFVLLTISSIGGIIDKDLVALANAVDELDKKIEDLRDDIVKLRKENNVDEKKVDEKKKAIQEAQKQRRRKASAFEEGLRKNGAIDQELYNYLSSIETIVNNLANAIGTVNGRQVVYSTDFSSILTERRKYGKLKAKSEIKVLREVRNRMRTIGNRVAAIREIDSAAMAKRDAAYTAEIASLEKSISQWTNELAKGDSTPRKLDDYLSTKCLVKITEASYETVSACNVVNFAMKGKSFMRISGRAPEYGQEKAEGYEYSDNGLKHRSSFFLMWVKEVPASVDIPINSINDDTGYSLVPRIFCLRRAADNELYFPLYFKTTNVSSKWRFKFVPIFDTPAECRTIGYAPKFAYLKGAFKNRSPKEVSIPGIQGASVLFFGEEKDADRNGLAPINRSPYDIDEWRLYSTSSDASIQFSFDNGPEFEITCVSEQQHQALNSGIYANLTLLGFNCYSGRGLRSLRSLSAFVTKGKIVRRINVASKTAPNNPDGPSNYASDIFLDTVLDPINGIGKYADKDGIGMTLLADSKRMCMKQGYFMDGVIADVSSWREFWARVAPFSMLEFARIGGKDTLIPALPVDALGQITRSITISALFNQGNILEDSYKEEFLDYGDNTQDIIATVIYRRPERNGVFPQNASLRLRLKVASADATPVTFDLSQFVTNKTQAKHYGMMMCLQRRYSQKAVEFKTLPSQSPVAPGSFIYVQEEESRWDKIKTGVIEQGGGLNVPLSAEPFSGTFTMLVYDGQNAPFKFNSISIASNILSPSSLATIATAIPNYAGSLFVVGLDEMKKRVFKVTEVQMDEEGEVTIRAIEHRCNGSGLSEIANFDDNLFDIDAF